MLRPLGEDAEIPIQDSPLPIEIYLPWSKEESGVDCGYFDGKEWRGGGVSVHQLSSQGVICHSKHLTDFAILLAANIGPRDIRQLNWASETGVVYILSLISICCACSAVFIVIAVFLRFPVVRNFVLSAETPGTARKSKERKVQRAKRSFVDSISASAIEP